MNTRQKILDKALEMFNERGIEYVGLRELAALLDMRVSNITYYFPTKDDLVYELSQQLAKRNSETIKPAAHLTMRTFLEMMHQVFVNHIEFRCLLLSFVHVMQQNKVVSAAYKKTQLQRTSTIRTNLESLASGGYLKVEETDVLDFLVAAVSLISRFWISEAAVSFRNLSEEQQMKRSLLMVTKLLTPYATTKGKKEIQLFEDAL